MPGNALGANLPALYALLASSYLARFPGARRGLAELAVLMRSNAARHDGAHLRAPVTVADVLASRPIAEPLRLLDCCPVSDGGSAVVVTAEPTSPHAVRIAATAQAHLHQHLTQADLSATGELHSAALALRRAGVGLANVTVAGVYDSFTITLALLLEEIGFAGPGEAGAMAASGGFSGRGACVLNPDGGRFLHTYLASVAGTRRVAIRQHLWLLRKQQLQTG